MENFKYAFYYTTRNILWQYAYSFLYLGMLAVALGVPLVMAFGLSMLESSKINIGENAKDIVLLILGNAFFCLLVFGAIVLCYFAQKKALQKVFFKPYKRFRLISRVERITPKMVWFYIVLSLPTFLVSWAADALIKPHFNVVNGFNAEFIKYLLASIVCGTPLSYMYVLFMNRFFVQKYATIVDKGDDTDTTLPVATPHDEV